MRIFYINIIFCFSFSFGCKMEKVINEVGNYKDGKKDGKNIFYDKDGRIYWSGNYKDGVLVDGGFIKSDNHLICTKMNQSIMVE